MSPVTHFLTGWVVANCSRLDRRERAIVALACVAPDLDGLAGLAFLSFHIHLVEDTLGSRGPDGYQWPIPYLAAFSTKLLLTWSVSGD